MDSAIRENESILFNILSMEYPASDLSWQIQICACMEWSLSHSKELAHKKGFMSEIATIWTKIWKHESFRGIICLQGWNKFHDFRTKIEQVTYIHNYLKHVKIKKIQF